MLELDGAEGAKSVVKFEKRERNRKFKQYHLSSSIIIG